MSSARLRNWSSICTDLAGTPEEQLLHIRLAAIYAGASSAAQFFLLDGSKTYVAFDEVFAIPPEGQLYVLAKDGGAGSTPVHMQLAMLVANDTATTVVTWHA